MKYSKGRLNGFNADGYSRRSSSPRPPPRAISDCRPSEGGADKKSLWFVGIWVLFLEAPSLQGCQSDFARDGPTCPFGQRVRSSRQLMSSTTSSGTSTRNGVGSGEAAAAAASTARGAGAARWAATADSRSILAAARRSDTAW